jgi:branched-chain amino acid transport system ATP-binding protein
MGLVLAICDRIVVLEFGKVIAAGPPDEVRRDPLVVKAYLGGADAVVPLSAIEAPEAGEVSA